MSESLRLLSKITRKLSTSAEEVRHRARLRAHSSFRPVPDQAVDVLVNFPGEPVDMYQIRQWYGPLEYLANSHQVAILCYQPSTAELVSQEVGVKVVLTPSYTDLGEVKDELNPKVILYPNQNYANYRLLGLTSAEHVFISHGESDKIYMASNWVKVFNYFFVAGEASRERLREHVRNYNVDKRTIAIGRPQIDIDYSSPLEKRQDRITVLYSPTWEGGRLTMRYGSVASHGVNIVSSLLSDERYRVIYRPHPRTGVEEKSFVKADEEIRGLIVQANAGQDGPHFIDDTPFGWHLDVADVMITDISAVAYDWLTTAKPLLITRPQESQAVLPDKGFIPQMPLLSEEGAKNTANVIESLLNDDEERKRRSAWADFYYGDRTPGSSLDRFVRAVEHVIDERNRAMAVDTTFAKRWPDFPMEEAPVQSRPSIVTSVDRGLTFVRRSLDFATSGIANMIAQSRVDSHFVSPPDSAMLSRHSKVLVSTMAGPHDIDLIVEWLPSLERLDKTHSLALMAGNHRTYEKLRELTTLRVYIGRSASETEEIFSSLSPDLHLQFEQANLNLRETTHRNMRHAYVGSKDSDSWLNNRLRLFDIVVAPSESTNKKIRRELIDFPDTVSVLTAPTITTQGRVDLLNSILAKSVEDRPSGDAQPLA